jgi:very-short-patch-repair endonuclease
LPARRIVQGQHITEAKHLRAKQFRREMTPAERALWAALRGNQLRGQHFRRQQVIDGFLVDFYCHKVGLVVEIDGSSHAGREDYDAERDRILSARGLHIHRVTNEDVFSALPTVLARIAHLFTEHSTADPHSGQRPASSS